MCGIAGKVCFAKGDGAVSPELIEGMVRTLRHRGPDDWGVHVDPRRCAGIGMSRLSIIDLKTGHQPVANEDGSVLAVLNGEIYNFRDIRRRLAGRHRFATQSDTEVLVHLYEEHGDELVDHLRGMFAFAIWDSSAGRLLLARDRLGQKPLYVAHDSDGRSLVFGSEIKALLAAGSISRQVDPVAMDEYLTYGFVPAPRSIYESIRKVPPACRGVFDSSGWRVERYWSADYSQPAEMTEEHALDRFEELLAESVELRMISDVPLGCFLSGGMDSAIITALMGRVASEPVRTFSIGFADRQFNELEAARRTSAHCGTEHHERIVDWNVRDMVPVLARHFDEPFGDSSAIPTWHVSKMARERITVALSGDGGDELLAGYNRYQARRLAGRYLKLPRLLRPRFIESLVRRLPTTSAYFGASMLKSAQYFLEYVDGLRRRRWQSWLLYFDDDLRTRLYSESSLHRLRDAATSQQNADPASIDAIAAAAGALDGVLKTMWIDMRTYLPGDILVKVDRMSMAVSLEARSPFLDHKLVEFLATVPLDLKLRGTTRKYLLRKLLDRYFPKGMFERGKQGFSMPLAAWLKGELGRWVQQRLTENDAFRTTLRMPVVEDIFEEHRRGRNDHSYRIWALLMLGEFLRG